MDFEIIKDIEIIKQMGLAVGLSTLIGLEREQKMQQYGKADFGGIRTFALAGLLGFFTVLINTVVHFFAVSMAIGFFALLMTSYFLTYTKYKYNGITTELAAVLVFIVGVLSAMGRTVLAIVLTLTLLVILHFKNTMHLWAKHLKNEELVSTIKFIIIAFIVLPLLPDVNYGPYGFFNPYVVWLMVVFISGISFVSYVAIKFLGAKRGIGLTGFFAGFISSTALALTFSGQSKINKKIVTPYVIAVIIACSAMFFRIITEVLVLNRDLLPTAIIPMSVMGGIGLISLIYFYFKKNDVTVDISKKIIEMDSPFSLIPALKFGLFFAFILFFVKFTNDLMGDHGIYLASIVSGALDVDAITISMAELAKGTITNKAATYAITLAAITNTFVKGGFFVLFGSRKVMIRIISVFAIMVICGGLSLLFI